MKIAMSFVCLLVLACPAWGLQGPGMPGDPREDILELFRKIESDLAEIDKLLLEAGSAGSAEKSMEASKNMEDLLRRTMEGQKRVSESIDEILRKLPPDGQGSGSSSQSQQPPQSSSQDQAGEKQREKTPLDPGQMQPAQPQGTQKDERPGKNVPARPPINPPADPAKHEQYGGKWGELPPLYQELFRNQKTDDVPLRYRRWIEDYYRRSNRAKP